MFDGSQRPARELRAVDVKGPVRDLMTDERPEHVKKPGHRDRKLRGCEKEQDPHDRQGGNRWRDEGHHASIIAQRVSA